MNKTKALLIGLIICLPILLFAQDESSTTCTRGDCITGKGILVYENGNFYEGDFKNGKFSNFGKFIFFNGDVYEGQMLENNFHGKGTYTFQNGDQFVGTFFNGSIVRGEFTSTNGNKYVGPFYNNLMHGNGVVYNSDGAKIYAGEWSEGCPVILFDKSSCNKPEFLSVNSDFSQRTLGANMDKIKISPYLKALQNPPTVQRIDPTQENKVTGQKGVRLIIPKNAFTYQNGKLVKKEVEIRLTEVIDAFDFLTAGVGLEYYGQDGKQQLFESGGMFKVEAFGGGKELKIADGKSIQVMFPDIYPDKNFNVYKMDDQGKWVLGEDKPKRLTLSSNYKNYVAQDEGGNETWAPSAKARTVSETIRRVFGVIVTSTNKLSWLNIDYPNLLFSCIKGDLELVTPSSPQKRRYVQVMAVGIDHSYIRNAWTPSGNYDINVLKNKKVKLFAVDEDGNLGISDEITTPDKTGYSRGKESPENYKMLVEKITLQRVEKDVFKNRNKFKELLGIRDKDYEIKYPESKEDKVEKK